MKFDPKIIDDFIKSIEYYNFQDFCDRLLLTLYPDEYTPVRAGGRHGDMKNDGYCIVSRIFFQAHASRGESASEIKKKIKEDLEGCLSKWSDVSKFVYITNDTLIGEVENFVDDLRRKYTDIIIETWSNKKLSFEIKKLAPEYIEYIIDRRIVPEPNFIDCEYLNAKYLLTNEFDLMKSISTGDLSDFPFENPILLENLCLKFLRSLISTQSFRKDGIENPIDSSELDYTEKHPDSKKIPYKEGEYRFFYHERIPKKEEVKTILNADKVSQFLLKNGIPTSKISKINTCYESECDGSGKFQELFILRPLYAQYLVIKNISNSPIKLDSFESLLKDGVLNYETAETEFTTNLPDFTIEPQQNVIILIGLFLSDYKKIEERDSQTVTSQYVCEQIQVLNLGELENKPIIEFFGPRFIPKKVNVKFLGKKYSFKIHDFTMNNVYWINRHWLCGSCPHLFFIKSNGEILYKGEIFSVSPNKTHIEALEIPSDVGDAIIAELEKETTQIDTILINDVSIVTDITLIENDYYQLKVSPFDNITIKGKYILNSETSKQLTLIEKKGIVDRFKKNYAQHIAQCGGQTINFSAD